MRNEGERERKKEREKEREREGEGARKSGFDKQTSLKKKKL